MHPAHPIIQPFLNYLKFEKRFSQHTVVAYETDLIHFFDFLSLTFGTLTLSEITHTYVRSWLASLKDEGLTAKSINRKISTLRSFFKYAVKINAVEQTPMGKVTAPKIEKRLPHFVADTEMQTLLQHVTFEENWKGKTDRLLLLLFYHTGMRLSEVINLKESGISEQNSSLKVLGKGNKERVIPVGERLMQELKEYLRAKREQFPDVREDVFLLHENGKKLTPRVVYSRVKSYLSLVTTIEKRSPHVLRHTFATHLTNNGADLNAVKELLGHSSLAATQVYTHNTIEKLKNVHRKAHPKA